MVTLILSSVVLLVSNTIFGKSEHTRLNLVPSSSSKRIIYWMKQILWLQSPFWLFFCRNIDSALVHIIGYKKRWFNLILWLFFYSLWMSMPLYSVRSENKWYFTEEYTFFKRGNIPSPQEEYKIYFNLFIPPWCIEFFDGTSEQFLFGVNFLFMDLNVIGDFGQVFLLVTFRFSCLILSLGNTIYLYINQN